MQKESVTREVAQRWFHIQTALSCLDENVECVSYNIERGYNYLMPWVGTYHGSRPS